MLAEKVGCGEVCFCHHLGDIHVVAAELGCGKVLVGTGWAICLIYTNKCRKQFSHFIRLPFQAL